MQNVPKRIDYPEMPLQGLLENTAAKIGEKALIICGEREISCNKLDNMSNQFANVLLDLGVTKGDRVALFMPNIPQFVAAFFGVLKAGAVVSAINPLHREREVEFQLRDSGAQTVVVLDTLKLVVEAVKEKTLVTHVITTDLGDSDFSGLLKGASTKKPQITVDPAQDLAALQYTGGTTGKAKAVMLTHLNLVSNALGFVACIRAKSDDVFLTVLPLSHIYGMTTSMTVPISLGAKMVLMPKFETTKVFETIQTQKVTVFCGVPPMYSALLANLQLCKYDLTSIRVCISGASSLLPQVQKQFMKITGGLLAEGYGLTEASPVTHCSPVDKSRVKVGSIGLPLPDTYAKIVDLETGKPLNVGETGELAVKGPQVMLGYWRRPEETALVLQDGWLLTGDIAHMDQDGYFYITDRKKDLIKTNGYSVYSRELEDLLYEHPAVKLCAVIGKPDPIAGEVPKAYIVIKNETTVSEKEIMAFINDKVAAYKAIRDIEFRKELPLNGVGKVLKQQLKLIVNPFNFSPDSPASN